MAAVASRGGAELATYLAGYFREAMELTDSIAVQQELKATTFIQENRLETVRETVGEMILGHRVQVFQAAGAENPITRFTALNPHYLGPESPQEDKRRVGDKPTVYSPATLFTYPRCVRGKVVGLELDNGAFVVKPRWKFDTRFWVQILRPDGEPAIGMDLLD